MLNAEKYRYELKRILSSHSFVAVVNGQPKKCTETNCTECDLETQDCNCQINLGFWLLDEQD